MGQATYDAQHGMSPEELWARYRKYPWLNNAGELDMMTDSGYAKGPGLPEGVYKATMPKSTAGLSLLQSPYKTQPAGVLINALLSGGSTNVALNHELQHQQQMDIGQPIGPAVTNGKPDSLEEYTNSPGEEQARAQGHRSARPRAINDMVHPFSDMYKDGPFDYSFTDEKSMIPDFITSIYNQNSNGQRMPKAFNKRARETAGRGLSLMDLLQQGREQYVPPFISDGLQK